MLGVDTASAAAADWEVDSDERSEANLLRAVDVPREKSAAAHHNILALRQPPKAYVGVHLVAAFEAKQKNMV